MWSVRGRRRPVPRPAPRAEPPQLRRPALPGSGSQLARPPPRGTHGRAAASSIFTPVTKIHLTESVMRCRRRTAEPPRHSPAGVPIPSPAPRSPQRSFAGRPRPLAPPPVGPAAAAAFPAAVAQSRIESGRFSPSRHSSPERNSPYAARREPRRRSGAAPVCE